MTITLPIAQARNKLTRLPKELHNRDTAAITRNGKPVMAIIPWDLYESLHEALEILSDPDLMQQFHKSLDDIKKGRVIPLSKVKKELGL